MNLMTKTEQLRLARETRSIDKLKELHSSKDMNIRRAVARNTNITTEIANILVFDPVLNVSYMAFKNPNCTVQRDFSQTKLTTCVLCEVEERSLNCLQCKNKGRSLLNFSE